MTARPPHLATTCRERLPLAPGEATVCGAPAWAIVDDAPRCERHAATRRALLAVARVAPGVLGRGR
jgi:hypothetical protein